MRRTCRTAPGSRNGSHPCARGLAGGRAPLAVLPWALAFVAVTSACVASPPGRPVLTHPRLALLHTLADQVTRAASDEGLPADVRVLVYDAWRLNAVGRPPGRIYVTRGLLERAGPEALTHVLAHEVAHHALGHFGRHRVGARRDEEMAADCAAVRIVTRLGYDAAGYAATLDWFRLTLGLDARDDIPTHPPLEERAQRVTHACRGSSEAEPDAPRSGASGAQRSRMNFPAWIFRTSGSANWASPSGVIVAGPIMPR